MSGYFESLTSVGRNELLEAAVALGNACMEVAFRVSDIGQLVPDRSMKALDTRDAFLMLVETQVDRFFSKADPDTHDFIEKHAKAVLPERIKPAPVVQSPSFFEIAKDITNPMQFLPVKAVEHSAEVLPFNRRGV